ncbi:MAG: winged helix-turn-helix domain-containing protein [Nitrososphaera sp.]|jgi:predicted transcriptional regulator
MNIKPRVARDKNEILEQILGSLEDGRSATRSRIMYYTLTGLRQADSYLKMLERSGLIERLGPQIKSFRITPKGRKLLELLRACELKWPSSSPQTLLNQKQGRPAAHGDQNIINK